MPHAYVLNWVTQSPWFTCPTATNTTPQPPRGPAPDADTPLGTTVEEQVLAVCDAVGAVALAAMLCLRAEQQANLAALAALAARVEGETP